MSQLPDLLALSLLPPWTRRHAAAALRAGDRPDVALSRLASKCASAEVTPAALRELAAAAERRAAAGGLAAVFWSDPAYPAALAAIVDLPLVLWV
jgi:predicted Rossmann fold nucleotide-binding protein DprA/Smf involved in DNA uptake